MLDNLPIAICYPAGAGGEFVNAAIQLSLFDSASVNCIVSKNNGDCHQSLKQRFQHFTPSTSIDGQQQELTVIKNLELVKKIDSNHAIYSGHFRNLVALQDIHPQLWFVKISHDVDNQQQCELIFDLLNQKAGSGAIEKYYTQVRHPNWPKTFDEWIVSGQAEQLYKQTVMYTNQNWYWVENASTRKRTITLTLEDVFVGKISTKLYDWFDLDTCNKLDQKQQHYQTINQNLFPQIKEVLAA